MSRTDKKPTYANKAYVTLAAWSKLGADPEMLAAWMPGTDPGEWTDEFALALASSGNVDLPDIYAGVDKTAVFAGERSHFQIANHRQGTAREFLMYLAKNSDKIYCGAPAAVIVADELNQSNRWAIQYESSVYGVRLAGNLLALTANDAMWHPSFAQISMDMLSKDTHLITDVGIVVAARKALSSSVSRDVFLEWTCIGKPAKNQAVFETLAAKTPEQRFLHVDSPLVAFGYTVHYAAGVTILRKDRVTYLLDRDGRDKVRKMVTSAAQARIYNKLNEIIANVSYPYARFAAQIRGLFRAASSYARAGKSHADVCKALGKWFMGALQSTPEDADPQNVLGGQFGEALYDEARALWPGVDTWMAGWGATMTYESMELAKLSNILVSDDADPDACVERLGAAQEVPRIADAAVHKDFMNFVKAYDYAREASVTQRMPSYGGVEPRGGWLTRCLSGQFSLPPRADWGKFWIEKYYDDLDTTPYEWLDAQDVTWVGPYEGDDLAIGNELVEAWINGPRIDRIREGPAAADYSLAKGIVAYWATKAENMKRPDKMRLTASTDAGSRALFSSFESAQRAHAAPYPAFAQGLDPFTMAEKVNAINRRSETSAASIASSHDVEGWSEYEDRRAKDEYLTYEARKYKDPAIQGSHRLWDRVHSVFNRMGRKYSGMFVEGGIQGLNGAADTLMHAKIVAYVHQRGIEEGIISGGANALTCIDDVVHNPNTTIKDLHKRAARLRKHIADIYKALAHDLDPTKSIMGVMKHIFLAEAYSDKALIASPLRVALKMDIDEQAAIRDVHTDVSSFFSTGSAIGIAQGHPVVAYYMAAINTGAYLHGLMRDYVHRDPAIAAVWALAPPVEGGLGVPTYREFIAGGDPDRSYTWRDAILNNGISSAEQISALAAMSGHALLPVGVLSTFRDPLAIHHDAPMHGQGLKRVLIAEAMSKHAHAREWDELRRAGNGALEKWTNAISDSGGTIDAVLSGDIANQFPDAIYEGALSRFTNSMAVTSLTSPRNVWRMARACARADRKWLTHMKHVLDLKGYVIDNHVGDVITELRAVVHPTVTVVNNVIPSPRAYVAFGGVFSGNQNPGGDFVAVNSRSILTAGGRARFDQRFASSGRQVGIKSARLPYTEVGKMIRKNPVGSKIATMSMILAAMEYVGMPTDQLATTFELAWGIDYGVNSVGLTDAVGSSKRISGIVGRTHNLALAFRHVYAASHARVNSLMDFCETTCEHTIVNPLAVAHTVRMCALSASLVSGYSGGTFGNISWAFRPAIGVDYEYVVHPAAFCYDDSMDLDIVPMDATLFAMPTLEDIHDAGRIAGLDVLPTGGATTKVPEVQNVALYKVRIEPLDVGEGSRARSLQPVRRPVPTSAHGKNVVATSILRTRVIEHCDKTRVNVSACIWDDDEYDPYIPVNVIDKIAGDIQVILGNDHAAIGKAFNHATRTNEYSGKNPAEVHSLLHAKVDHRRKVIACAYDGVVGRGESAYSNAQRGLIVVTDPASYNQRKRAQLLASRSRVLASRYTQLIKDSDNADSASYNQGRLCARIVYKYEAGNPTSGKVDNGLLVGFLAQRSGHTNAEIRALLDDDECDAVRANLVVGNHFRDLGWVHAAFMRGWSKEAGYVAADLTSIEDRVFAVSSGDVANVEGGRVSNWTAVATAVEAAEPAPLSVLQAIAAAAARIDSTITGNLWDNWVADSDDDEEVPTIW